MGGLLTVDNLLINNDAEIGGEIIGSKQLIMFNGEKIAGGDPLVARVGQTEKGVLLNRAGSITGYTVHHTNGNNKALSLVIEIDGTAEWTDSLGNPPTVDTVYSNDEVRGIHAFTAGQVLTVAMTGFGVSIPAIILIEVMYDD